MRLFSVAISVSRRCGSTNVRTQVLKDAMLIAADQVGEIEVVKVLDDDGQPTGEIKYEYSGVDGLIGYLRWAAVHRPASFMMMLGRILPTQLNVKITSSLKVTYKNDEETRQALKDRGIDEVMVAEILKLEAPKKGK